MEGRTTPPPAILSAISAAAITRSGRYARHRTARGDESSSRDEFHRHTHICERKSADGISLDGREAPEGWPASGAWNTALDLVNHRTFDGRLQLLEDVPPCSMARPVLPTDRYSPRERHL
jgi:hypothetical protein